MSILSAIRQQSSSIDDLAKLPQAMIMQMAQRKQIAPEMVAPILSRKAEMIDAAVKTRAMQQEVPQTSVLEQILAQNAQAEQPMERDNMGIAQIPVPEPQYAGGGIIAFDEGGDVEEEYEDRVRRSRMSSFALPIEQLYAMASRVPSQIRDMIPQSYTAAKANAPTQTQPTETPIPRKGGNKYEEAVIQEAIKQGVDPSLALHVLYKETGNLKNPENAKSPAGALGVMQLMPKTAKELGVDPLDPMQNIQGGISYLKKMYAKYQDPALAAAAYNAGPGRVDRALRSEGGLGTLPRETRNYMVGLASGGEVKHFQYGGSTMGGFEDPYTDIGVPINPQIEEYVIDPMTGEKLFSGRGSPSKKKEVAKKEPVAPQAPKLTEEEIARYTAPSKPEERDIFADLIAQRMADREAIKKSSAEDRNLALLAAGLGMMSGTSPYAAANIGAGALKGVEALAASKARRAAELGALNKSEVEAIYYGEESKRRGQAQRAIEAERAIDNLANYDAKVRKGYFMEGVAPTQKQIEAYENFKRNDPIYQRLAKSANISSVPAQQPNRISFSSIPR